MSTFCTSNIRASNSKKTRGAHICMYFVNEEYSKKLHFKTVIIVSPLLKILTSVIYLH